MITFGTDPEFMLIKDGELYSAVGIVQGDADNRITIKGHQFYFDNVAAECAVKPASSAKQAVKNIRECLTIYAAMVRPFRLEACASASYPEDQLCTEEARRVACSIDYSVYDMESIPVDQRRNIIETTSFRSCGGHVHVGHSCLQGDGEEPLLAVLMMDLFLGLPSLWLDVTNAAKERRRIYGQAGCYRITDYGIEYRTLSNFWLSRPSLVELVFELSDLAVSFVKDGRAGEMWEFDMDAYTDHTGKPWQCVAYDGDGLQTAIEIGDKSLATAQYRFLEGLIPAHLWEKLQSEIGRKSCSIYDSWQIPS